MIDARVPVHSTQQTDKGRCLRAQARHFTHHALAPFINIFLLTLGGSPCMWSILLILSVHRDVVSPLVWHRRCHFFLSSVQSCN
jgi:hypothetical protein